MRTMTSLLPLLALFFSLNPSVCREHPAEVFTSSRPDLTPGVTPFAYLKTDDIVNHDVSSASNKRPRFGHAGPVPRANPFAKDNIEGRALSSGPQEYFIYKSYLLSGTLGGATFTNEEFVETGESCGSLCVDADCSSLRFTRIFESISTLDLGTSFAVASKYYLSLDTTYYYWQISATRCKSGEGGYASGFYANFFDPVAATGWHVKNSANDAWVAGSDIVITGKAGTEVTECSAGSYKYSSSCTACPARRSDSHQGATSISDCFSKHSNLVVSCPFASRLVSYNHDVGENERLAEDGEIRGMGNMKDIEFISNDRFLTTAGKKILEYDIDGEYKRDFSTHSTDPNSILKVNPPSSSSSIFVAVAVGNMIYVREKQGESPSDPSDSITIENSKRELSYVADFSETIMAMETGASWDEIILTTSWSYTDNSAADLTYPTGGRVLRVCVLNPLCTKSQFQYLEMSIMFKAIAKLPSRDTFLVSTTGSTGEFEYLLEIPMDESLAGSWYFFDDGDPAGFYKPTDIVVDDVKGLVYIECPDLTQLYNYYGHRLSRYETNIGYTTEPEQIALKPGPFAHFSDYEVFSMQGTKSTTIVAGEPLTIKVTLRDRYDEYIDYTLNDFEVGRFKLTAYGEVALNDNTFETEVPGFMIRNETESDDHKKVYGLATIKQAGAWNLHVTEGKTVVQTVGERTDIMVIPAATDPAKCKIEDMVVAKDVEVKKILIAGDTVRTRMQVVDSFQNPTYHENDSFLSWLSSKNHTTGDLMRRDNNTNSFTADWTIEEAGETKVHVAFKPCIDACADLMGFFSYEACIQKCDVEGSPYPLLINPADVNAANCSHDIEETFDSGVFSAEMKVTVKVRDMYSNVKLTEKNDPDFVLKVQVGGKSTNVIMQSDPPEAIIDIPASFEGIVTYEILYNNTHIEGSPGFMTVSYVEAFSMVTILTIIGGVAVAIFVLYILYRGFSSNLNRKDVMTEMGELQTNVMAFSWDTIDHLTDWVTYVTVTSYTDLKLYFIIFIGTGMVSTITSIGVNFWQIKQLLANKRIAPDDQMTDQLSSLELWARQNNIDEEIKKRDAMAHDLAEKRREAMKLSEKGAGHGVNSKTGMQTSKKSGRSTMTKGGGSMITGVFGGTRRTSRSTKIQTQTTGSNFSVKSGAILPSLSGTFRKDGSMSTSESKLNNTRIDLLKMLRERHEHCVDKFLTQRQKIRALVGFTVVICEDTPLTILNLYLFVWGCDYKEYYAKEFNIAGDAVDENSEKEIDQCSVTENRYKYLFWVVCVMMTVWLVGWKLKDVYELVSLNRRIGHLDILIEAATSEGEELIKDIEVLITQVQEEAKLKQERKSSTMLATKQLRTASPTTATLGGE